MSFIYNTCIKYTYHMWTMSISKVKCIILKPSLPVSNIILTVVKHVAMLLPREHQFYENKDLPYHQVPLFG